MKLNPQGEQGAHERVGATADDMLLTIYESLFHLSFELRNDVVGRAQELIDDADKMMGWIADFRERAYAEEIAKLCEGYKKQARGE